MTNPKTPDQATKKSFFRRYTLILFIFIMVQSIEASVAGLYPDMWFLVMATDLALAVWAIWLLMQALGKKS